MRMICMVGDEIGSVEDRKSMKILERKVVRLS